MMVPHSIITVSLATAILPRISGLAADGRARRPRPHAWARRCAPRWSSSCRSPRSCRSSRPTSPTCCSARRRRRPTSALRADAGALRPGPGLLHRPLPHAARVLRPRADPPRLLHPVRDRRHQHRAGRGACRSRHARPARLPALVLAYWVRPTSWARSLSYSVLRRPLGGLRTPRWCASWCGWPSSGCRGRRGLVAVELGAARARATSPAPLLSLLRGGLAGIVGLVVLLLAARALRIREVTTVSDPRIGQTAAPLMPSMAWPPRPAPRRGESEVRVPDSLHAGDVLAQRYRLDELLTESAGGRFWRAHDQVLDRAVAVHVIARRRRRADGPARRCAAYGAAPRSPVLRVLDADRGDDLLRRERVGLGHVARHHARRVRPVAAAAGRVDRLRGGRQPGAGPRGRARPRADGPRERADRPPGPGADHRLRRRRRPARTAAGPTGRRPRRHRRGALRRADRQVGRHLRLAAAARADAARRGAATAPGARRHPAPARRAVRPGDQPAPRARPALDSRPDDHDRGGCARSPSSSATRPGWPQSGAGRGPGASGRRRPAADAATRRIDPPMPAPAPRPGRTPGRPTPRR